MKDKIINAIKDSKGIILGAHINPDGDAVGALVGMATLCGFLHIPYQVMLEKIPESSNELLKDIEVNDTVTIDYDTFISVDCGDAERLGKYKILFEQAAVTINIDHHETNTSFADLNEVHADASSSCEVVYDFIKLAKCPLTSSLAAGLYTGILTDTGGFMHPCTSASTHQIVAELLQVPFDFTKIYYNQMVSKSEIATIMESVAISHLSKINNKSMYMAYVTIEEMKDKGATKEDLGSIVSQVKNIKGCEVAVFIYPIEEEKYKVSFRSNAPYDVAKIATTFGGGGHIRAAGATLSGTLEQVIGQICKALNSES